jgi:hypothetical protein
MNGAVRHDTGTHSFGAGLAGIHRPTLDSPASTDSRQGNRGNREAQESSAKAQDSAHGNSAGKAATESRAARLLGYAASFLALFALGYMLVLALAGCATARPQVEQTLTTAAECLTASATQCYALTVASCASLPTRVEIYECARVTYPGCLMPAAALCASGAWTPPSTEVPQ